MPPTRTRTPAAAPCKKRHKSFSGCWTCRARKVKCDEARPICVQCDSKQLDCEGYEVRLRWMPLEAGSSGGSEADHQQQLDLLDLPPHRAQRSLIACVESGQSPLRLSELDQIFYLIDNFEHAKDAASPHDPDAHLLLSNFGVFNAFNAFHGSSGTCAADLAHHQVDDTGLSTTTDPDSWLPNEFDGVYEPEVLPSVSSLDSFDGLGKLPAYDSIAADTGSHVSRSARPPCSPPESFNLPRTLAADDAARDASRSLWWKADGGAIIQNPSAHQMPELERFLLNHYVHRVVHLFCVIDYEKSPWKTIHLPRVVQSTGELSLHGSTSTIRHALRNALLSISAFYLSNDHMSRSCEDEAEEWASNAIKFRGRAIKLLKETVESSTPPSPPKYKEWLATILSMITINVMSGDTSTCGIHLDGAFRFMNHARSWKSRYSSKARSLHRIYFYLRVIYDSTACRGPDDDASPLASPGADAASALSAAFLDSNDDTSVLSHVSAPRAQIGAYECVYGVPQSLLILLARATDLIEQTTSARRNGTASEHSGLSEQCDALESDILDWVADTSPSEGGPSSRIIHKTTVAFHNALIIYFAQHIRLMRHSYLKTHIEVVLDSIEDIESIKTESGILAAPLYWPAFIAGSEAFDQKLQDRFRWWYDQVETYRIASVRTGISTLTEVWKNGPPTSKNRTTSQWRSVVRRTGARLMLS